MANTEVPLRQGTVGCLNPAVTRPGYDREAVSVGMVYFGVGGFHRAHQAIHTDTLMSQGEALAVLAERRARGIRIQRVDLRRRMVTDPAATVLRPYRRRQPLDFVDPYALTKDVSERTGQMFARREMSVIALRFHWVLRVDELSAIWDDTGGEDGARNLWGYVKRGRCSQSMHARADCGHPDRQLLPTRDRGRRHHHVTACG